jgi:hypothetical protein
MKFFRTLFRYLKWHYSKALLSAFALWKNILVFLFNFFSIKNILGNFFTPWKRLADNYPEHFNLKEYFFIFLLNSIMRIVGVLLRSIILFVGLSICTLYIILLPFSLVVWLALPPIVLGLIILGLILIIFA